MYLLLGIMLVIGTGNRLFAALSKHVNRGDPEDMHLGAPVRDTLISKVYTWYLRRIAVPATFGYRHMQPWGWLSIPTRIQAILVSRTESPHLHPPPLTTTNNNVQTLTK